MRRIDAEYDIPQFVAASLVRKIAANKFRLPATDRSRFQKLPDHVIARIEEMVREAYFEAGEDVGGDTLREHLWRQALDGRREMIANGELLSPADFRARLGASDKRLARLLDDGSVFAVEVDGAEYIPAVLADPAHNLRRLQAICRIIVPAPTLSRLDFLVSQNGSLCDRRPLDMLEDDNDFKSLKRLAEAWAAQWSRTTVRLYDGEHETEPTDSDALSTAMAEIDPRRALWERASEALHVHGYHWPLGPYPDVRSFTLFVERHTSGGAAPTPEACVQILVDGEHIRIRIVAAPGATLRSRTMPTGNHKGLIDIAKRVIAHLTNAKRA
ncbi:hypothetical protein J2777_005881 [Paraburkholderia graminis]|uniref:hypothetical protein n=1 Tax=Paraburkholderia graminis TaxID=60548 RepID=UPI0028610BD6|nr:hypothetical protein [Paraburkholderia graminis]MDR6472140.1 hypothetical protein [Paraburkholderia graminis]